MKIRLLQPIKINGYQFETGQVIDVHMKAAQKYIKYENAELVTEVEKIQETKTEKDDAYQIQEDVQDTQDYSTNW